MDAGERGRTGTFALSLARSGSRYLEEGGAAGVSAFMEAQQLPGSGRWIPECWGERREREQGLGYLLPPHSSWEEKGILWSNFSWSE